jgi:hypothetical protein
MKPLCALKKFLKRQAKLVPILLVAMVAMANSSCSLYGNKEETKVVSHREKFRDDQEDILQSHTDAKQGLNLPPDQPGLANGGLGWAPYR